MIEILKRIFIIFRPAIPIISMLLGGIGIIFCLGTNNMNGGLLIISLLLMLFGVSIYTYEQAVSSEFFKQRFIEKESGKKKGKKRRRSGKKCPECGKVIYHRRTICQHCGYKFPSYKEPSEEEQESKAK